MSGGLEPFAQLVRAAMDAEQPALTAADVARITGLSRQYVSQVINRREPYKANRLPAIEKQQALARLRGLDMRQITDALGRSSGMVVADTRRHNRMSPARIAAHQAIDQAPESTLPRVLKAIELVLG